MVTRILFDPRRDLPNGTTQSNPVTIEATPTGIREDGQVVIYPTTISTPITTGADIFQLPANTASNGWRLTVRDTITSAVKQQRVVRVPDQASIAYQSLPDIDPASFTVTPGTARQWDATFWALIQAGAGGGLTDTGIAALIGNPASAVAVSLAATYLPFWKPNTAYVAGQRVVSPTGQTITANADFTSGANYVAANWTVVAGGGGGGGTVSDATTSAKGIVQLAGDLGGTAAAPTVPGLASKASTAALTSGLAGKADLVGGVIPTAQIPAIAIVQYLGTSANQAAMLALTGQQGDWTIRTDLGTTWQITGSDPTQLASWTALSYPTAPVQSVAGKTGVVTLTATDVGAASLASPAFTGTPTIAGSPIVKQSDLDTTAIQASDVQHDGTTTVAQRIASLLARVTVLESLALIASTAPAITGTATVGQTLTVTPGAFSNSPTSRTYQWNRAGAAISGATGTTYTLVSADAANQITVIETPVRTGYTGYPSTSAAVTVAAPTAPVTDNFTSATINGTNWPLSSGTTIVGGRARIPATTAYPGLTSGDVFDLSQYPLYVQIPTATNAGNGSVQTIFSLTDSSYANKIFFNINGSPRLVWMHGLGTTPTNVSGSQTITYDPAVHVWFRFRISGANLLFETSPDGTTWTVQRTVVTPAWITSGLRRVVLQAVYTGTEPTPGYAEFDNFNTLS